MSKDKENQERISKEIAALVTRIDIIREESKVLTNNINRLIEKRKDLSKEKRRIKELLGR